MTDFSAHHILSKTPHLHLNNSFICVIHCQKIFGFKIISLETVQKICFQKSVVKNFLREHFLLMISY